MPVAWSVDRDGRADLCRAGRGRRLPLRPDRMTICRSSSRPSTGWDYTPPRSACSRTTRTGVDGQPKPEFSTNRDGERVADAHQRATSSFLLTHLIQPFELAISTAYFNPGGFACSPTELEHPGQVRLLLGAEPEGTRAELRRARPDEPPERASEPLPSRPRRPRARPRSRTATCSASLSMPTTGAQRLVDWLRSADVEVRRLERWLPARQGIHRHDHTTRGVIAGSSNFTYAGLARQHRAEPRPVPAARRQTGAATGSRSCGT